MQKELEIVRLELKYCERCGELWLRRRGEGSVYCVSCLSQLGKLGDHGEATLPLRKHRIALDEKGGGFLLVCHEGGNA